MTGEIIKSFLVGLGFDVDDTSLSKFNKAITSASVKVTALYASIQALAAGVFASISKISEGFEEMGYEYRLLAPAINKALILRRELLKAYSSAGINIQNVILQSVKFNMSLAKTGFAFKAIYTSVAAKFFPLLTKQMDVFRKTIYANMPKIQAALERFVNFVFKAFEITLELGNRIWSVLSRVYEFFKILHDATNGWSTIILGAIAAWKLLNLSFLATPLGIIIAGFTALFLLWDDFKTFRDGGRSLIDWGSDATKTIIGLTTVIGGLAIAIGTLYGAYMLLSNAGKVYKAVQIGINLAMAANPVGIIIGGLIALLGLLTAADAKWQIFGGHLAGAFKWVGSHVEDFLSGSPNIEANLNTNPASRGAPSPLGLNTSNNHQNNVNLQQQTNMHIVGSADPIQTGQYVVSQQGLVNFDLFQNSVPRAK